MTIYVHPAEIDALHNRIDQLEQENQRLRENISTVLAREAKWLSTAWRQSVVDAG